MYLIRLDDASDYMDIEKWKKIEEILDSYSIKPIVGVIPNNQDKGLTSKYKRDVDFWDKVKSWQNKRWEIALHGYNHITSSKDWGINPMHMRSEFAGVPLEEQKEKIRKGMEIFASRGINTRMFFAPSHTYDKNTLTAIREESNINIISDTIANSVYFDSDFYFIPCQSGHATNLPLKIVTFCYHPNIMDNNSFFKLEEFIKKNVDNFTSVDELKLSKRRKSVYDLFLNRCYFLMRKIRNS